MGRVVGLLRIVEALVECREVAERRLARRLGLLEVGADLLEVRAQVLELLAQAGARCGLRPAEAPSAPAKVKASRSAARPSPMDLAARASLRLRLTERDTRMASRPLPRTSARP